VGVSRITRDHRGAEFDALCFSADNRLGQDGVVAENVGHPDRVKAAGFEVFGSGDESVEGAIGAGGCPGHNANTHGGILCFL
jgi:hypothetical protein